MTQRLINWRDIDRLVDKLYLKITKRDIKNIYGLPRGGLIPAVMLSHRIGVPMIFETSQITEQTLIVDDLTDSGATMNMLSARLPIMPKTAVLYHNKESKYKPTYYADLKPDAWIVFPYETEGSSKYDHTPIFNHAIKKK